MNTTSRGAANLVKMLAGHVATVAVLVVSGFLIPRALGAESFGRYTAVMAVVAIVQTAAALGLQQVEDRYLAPLWHTAGRRGEALELGSSIWTVRLVLALAAGAATALWLGLSPVELSGGVLAAAAFLALLRAAQEATRSQLLPLGHVGRMMALRFAQAVATLGVVLVAFERSGLPGVFTALPVLQGALFFAAAVVLLRVAPLRPWSLRFAALRPYATYGLSSFGAVVAGILQQQLGIYALAAWVADREAGLFAVGLQLYTVALGLYLAARRALIPALAELEASGQEERLRNWGELLLRYSAVAAAWTFAGWVFFGEETLRFLIRAEFVPAYPVATLLIASLVFYCGGASCDGLLLTRGRAGWVAVLVGVHSAVVLAGMAWAIHHGGPRVAVHVAAAYLLGSVVFFATAYVALGTVGGMWLPLRRTLLAVVPVLLAWQAFGWQAALGVKILVIVAAAAAYAVLVALLRLLPLAEVREIFRALRPGAG